MATLLKEEGRSEKSLLVDGGDFLYRSAKPEEYAQPYFQLKARFVAKAYSMLQFDGAALGPVDFALGLQTLRTTLDGQSFKVLAGNVSLEGKPFFPSFQLVVRNGCYVALIGLLAHRPEGLKDEGIVVADALSSLRKTVSQLRSMVDLIVVLTSFREEQASALAVKMNNVDVLLYGKKGYRAGSCRVVNNTILVEAAGYGRYLGKLDLWLSSRNGKGIVELAKATPEAHLVYSGKSIPILSSIAEDAKMKVHVDNYKKEVRKLSIALARRTKSTTPSRKSFFWGNGLCMQCHPKEAKVWKLTTHAKAYNTLKKVGRELDVECLPCHTVGFQQRGGYRNPLDAKNFAGVQCESCHGPGALHDTKEYKEYAERKENCTKCHSKDRCPDFDYEKVRLKETCMGQPVRDKKRAEP